VEGREAVKAPARHDREVSWGGQLDWLQRHTVISAATMRTHNLPSFTSISSGRQLHRRLHMSLLALLISSVSVLPHVSSDHNGLTCPTEQSISIRAERRGWAVDGGALGDEVDSPAQEFGVASRGRVGEERQSHWGEPGRRLVVALPCGMPKNATRPSRKGRRGAC
jgi:hypothetical protein